MAYVVTDRCIHCKYMECVEACPVPCFAEGKMMLVIDPTKCIDCGLCEPVCPANAIAHESEQWVDNWAELNRVHAAQWPKVSRKGTPFADADTWNGVEGKYVMFSSEPPALENARTAGQTQASGLAAGED
jgi:ferredoxin